MSLPAPARCFLLDAPSPDAVVQLLDEMAPLLNQADDYVQAWKLSKDQPRRGLFRGTAAILYPAAVVLHGSQALLLKEKHP